MTMWQSLTHCFTPKPCPQGYVSVSLQLPTLVASWTQPSSPVKHLPWASEGTMSLMISFLWPVPLVKLACDVKESYQAKGISYLPPTSSLPPCLSLPSVFSSLLPSWSSTPPKAAQRPSPPVILTWQLSPCAVGQFSSYISAKYELCPREG